MSLTRHTAHYILSPLLSFHQAVPLHPCVILTNTERGVPAHRAAGYLRPARDLGYNRDLHRRAGQPADFIVIYEPRCGCWPRKVGAPIHGSKAEEGGPHHRLAGSHRRSTDRGGGLLGTMGARYQCGETPKRDRFGSHTWDMPERTDT